ncbi:DNA polymerase Y family protein [Ferrimonas pelagia]|uniref:DNA polymerase Y family protein n=1 Tax=Ferrimonas pelagia TaxID=1177826 RepID=A0ABP9EC80_9GAMM
MLLGLQFVDLSLHHRARGQQLAGQPIALFGGHPLKVLQCNDEAAQQGVAVGQKLATATALCDALVLLQGDDGEDRATLETLAEWAYGFSAQVHLVAPDTLVLEVSSMLRLFDGLDNWLAQLKADLIRHGLPWRGALAQTPLAAQCLAQNGTALAQIAPADPALSQAALHPLSLAQLQRPEAARLASMGIQTLAQLMALPRSELGRRSGADLLLWLQRLLGERPDPRGYFQPPKHYRRKLVLLEEIEHLQGLRFPLKRLFAELGDLLRRRQLALPQLDILLHHRHRPTTVVSLRGAGNEHRSEAWMALCQLKLERLVLFEPVMELELVGERLQPQQVHSERLFAGGAPDGQAQDLLAQLAARLGEERIHGLQAVGEHRPEYASRVVAPGQGQDSRQSVITTLQRPCWLLTQPQPVSRTDYQLLRGPERIESGWWQAGAIARDYFQAQCPQGRLCWLFHSSDGWFLHGWF